MRELSFEDRLLVRELACACLEARKSVKMSQPQLARKLSTARTFISKIERAHTTPQPRTLHRIALACGLPGGWKLLQIAEVRLARRRAEPGTVANRRRVVGRPDVPALPTTPISVPDQSSVPDNASFRVAFGAMLKSARCARGMSQNGLGRKTGISHSRISTLERGLHCSGLSNLLRFADALNTPAWNLMRCAENRLTQPQPQTPAA